MGCPAPGRTGQGSGTPAGKQNWAELMGIFSLARPQPRPDQARQWEGRGLPGDCRQGAGPTAPVAGPVPTPHILWLVQCEVDLVDLSTGYGIWGDEEADPCDRARRELGITGLQRLKTPSSASLDMSLPLRTDWCYAGLRTEVPLRLSGCPTTHTGMKLNHSDPKRGQGNSGGKSMPC